MVEAVVFGLLLLIRKEPKEETVRRLMLLLDEWGRENNSFTQEGAARLAAQTQTVVRKSKRGPEHPSYVVQIHAKLLLPEITGFSYRATNDAHKLMWLKENLSRILQILKRHHGCGDACPARTALPGSEQLKQFARSRTPGQLRNKILAYYHRLKLTTVVRLVADKAYVKA